MTEYRTPAWIRVRQEDFGLLFYDTRSTQLTFVRSGDRLARRSCACEGRDVGLVEATDAGDEAVQRALDKLVAKGLLVSEPPVAGDAAAGAVAEPRTAGDRPRA